MNFKNYLISEAYNQHINTSKDRNIQKLIDYLGTLNNEEYPLVQDPTKTDYKIKRIYEPFQDDIKAFVRSENISIKYVFGNGSNPKNMNSLGKELADAGELATLLSLTKDINSPEDTEQPLFIDNPAAFDRWKFTFQNSRAVIDSIIEKPIKNYHIIHDATDKGPWTKLINKFTKKIGQAKDSWNPADVFLVNKSNFNKTIDKLNSVIDENSGKSLVQFFNAELYSAFLAGDVYPISLKQFKSTPKKEYTNSPKQELHYYDIKVNNFNVDFDINGKTKEIGLMTFLNKESGKVISMQNRPFPFKYSTTQTEITSDGSSTGGRLGKVPTRIVDGIMDEFNFSRITTARWFGTTKTPMKNLDQTKKKLIKDMYKRVSKHPRVNDYTTQKIDDIVDGIENATEMEQTLFMIKTQGLFFMYFFLINEKSISHIINEFIFGAKKINPNAGFFIKVY